MEFRHLESFLAIAEELHFGRAAARLHLAQPSLSQHLQRLERAVGVQLVSRTSHEVRLTTAGLAFRAEAERIVGQAARAVAAARSAAEGRSGTVNVGFNVAAGIAVLPGVLARLAEEYPKVHARLSERRTGPQVAALLSEELDVGFVYGPPRTTRLESRELMSLPLVGVVGPHHPLAGRKSVSMAELAGRPCLLFRRDQSPAMYDAIVHAAARAGTELTVAEEVDDQISTGLLVASRPLISFGSAVTASRTAALGMVGLTLTAPVPRVSLHVTWRAGETAPAVAALLASLPEPAPAAGLLTA